MSMSINAIHQFHCPTRLVHGLGSIHKTGPEVRKLGGSRVLIVTDPGIVQAGLLADLTASLTAATIPYRIFDGVGHDARVGPVDAAAKICQDEQWDTIVTIGGGSALAAGRAVSAIATNGGSLGDHQGVPTLPHPSLPCIAIPTSAGSGSEVSAAVPYYDEKRKRKTGTRHPYFFADVAILDANLMQSLPFRQAVLSGVDALTHAMEAYLTVRATPITDALALAAIRMLSRSLHASATTPDMAAKEQALLGSTMANMACGNAKLGLAHLLNRPINTLFPEVPYGESIGILLVPVMVFNLPADVERFANMAEAFGERDTGGSRRTLANHCLSALKQLLADLQTTRTYAKEKVDAAAIPTMAAMCAGGMHGGMKAQDLPDTAPVTSFNRRQATVGDVKQLYRAAFIGWTQ